MNPRIHPRFPDYEIHADGRVFRIRVGNSNNSNTGKLGELKGRVLKESGYRQFNLVNTDGGQSLIRANRLVCETFHGPAPSPSHQAAHNDGVRLNNAASNLRWATPKQNNADREIHGTSLKGANNSRSKLTESQILEIRGAFTGLRGELRVFAKRYGVGASTMGRVVYGDTYVELAAASAPPVRRSRRPTAAQRADIVDVYLTRGYDAALPLALACGISAKHISALARQLGFNCNHRRGRGLVSPGFSALERRA